MQPAALEVGGGRNGGRGGVECTGGASPPTALDGREGGGGVELTGEEDGGGVLLWGRLDVSGRQLSSE